MHLDLQYQLENDSQMSSIRYIYTVYCACGYVCREVIALSHSPPSVAVTSTTPQSTIPVTPWAIHNLQLA